MDEPVIALVDQLADTEVSGLDLSSPAGVLGVKLGTVLKSIITQGNAMAAVVNDIADQLNDEGYVS